MPFKLRSFLFSAGLFAAGIFPPFCLLASQQSLLERAHTLAIPEVSGTAYDRHRAEPFTFPFFILIQEEHRSYESQLKMAELIGYLGFTLGVKNVFVEGAEGRIDTSAFSSFPFKRTLEETLKPWVKEGFLSGAEFEAIAHNSELELSGIERERDYRYQYEAFFDALLLRLQFQEELHYLAEIIRRSKENFLAPDLFSLHEWLLSFEEGRLPVEELVKKVLPLAEKHSIATAHLRQLELFLAGENWYDRNQLYQEVLEIITKLEDKLCLSPEEFMFVAVSRGYSLLESIITLEASQESARQYFERPEDQKMTFEKGDLFFRRKFPELRPLDLAVLNQMLDKAKVFYTYGSRREKVLVNLALRQARAEALDIVVLVAGRAHTSGITQELREQNVSYFVITPNIHSFERSIPYEKRLLGKKTSLELFLEKGPGSHLRMPTGLRPIFGGDPELFLAALSLELYINGLKDLLIEKVRAEDPPERVQELAEEYEKNLNGWPGLSRVQKHLKLNRVFWTDPFWFFPEATLDGKPVCLFFKKDGTPQPLIGKIQELLKDPIVPHVFAYTKQKQRKIRRILEKQNTPVKEFFLFADAFQEHMIQVEEEVQEEIDRLQDFPAER